jgi:hypothetical protein
VSIGEPHGTVDQDSFLSVSLTLKKKSPRCQLLLQHSSLPPPSSSCQKERGDLNASTSLRPYLPSQLRCNDCHWHSCCLCHYYCRLPHFVDCCLPLQFLLLSATALAIVAAAATTEMASTAVTIAIRPFCHCNCPCCLCTCPLCCPPASLLLLSPRLLPLLSLAHHPYCNCSCRHCHTTTAVSVTVAAIF